jgi:hypothetical protein
MDASFTFRAKTFSIKASPADFSSRQANSVNDQRPGEILKLASQYLPRKQFLYRGCLDGPMRGVVGREMEGQPGSANKHTAGYKARGCGVVKVLSTWASR